MNAFEFSWKYKEFEIKSTKSVNANKPPYVELIMWDEYNGKPSCFTLAIYNWDSEGGEWHFVGERPFKYIADIDISTIWKQMWLASEMYNDWYKKEFEND